MSIITVNHINLYYESHGEGEPIIFVSGFSGDHTVWDNIRDLYAKEYRVIVFDNRGVGQSDCPEGPYTTIQMANDVVGLAHALGLDKIHLVGHSFGGCIVQEVLKHHPDLVQSAVIANSPAIFNTRSRLYAEGRLELIQAKAPESSIVKFITLLCWSESYLSQPDMAKRIVDAGFFPITQQGYAGQLHALLTFDSRDWLHRIQTPCLVMGGGDDVLVPSKDAEHVANVLPHAQYFRFDEVGHVPMIEQEALFNEQVLNFIEQHKMRCRKHGCKN